MPSANDENAFNGHIGVIFHVSASIQCSGMPYWPLTHSTRCWVSNVVKTSVMGSGKSTSDQLQQGGKFYKCHYGTCGAEVGKWGNNSSQVGPSGFHSVPLLTPEDRAVLRSETLSAATQAVLAVRTLGKMG